MEKEITLARKIQENCVEKATEVWVCGNGTVKNEEEGG